MVIDGLEGLGEWGLEARWRSDLSPSWTEDTKMDTSVEIGGSDTERSEDIALRAREASDQTLQAQASEIADFWPAWSDSRKQNGPSEPQGKVSLGVSYRKKTVFGNSTEQFLPRLQCILFGLFAVLFHRKTVLFGSGGHTSWSRFSRLLQRRLRRLRN